MSLQLQPVLVASEHNDSESQLVFSDGYLVAVLVRLSDLHQEAAGKWFLEVEVVPDGFDPNLGVPTPSREPWKA